MPPRDFQKKMARPDRDAREVADMRTILVMHPPAGRHNGARTLLSAFKDGFDVRGQNCPRSSRLPIHHIQHQASHISIANPVSG